MILLSLILATAMHAESAPQNPSDDLPDEVKQALDLAKQSSAWVDQMLLAHKDSRDLVAWGSVLTVIFHRAPWVTLRVIEEKLRRLDIDVSIVAVPAENVPNSCPRLPFDPPDVVRKYVALIALQGRANAVERMKSVGADERENLIRLGNAGFAMLNCRQL